MTRAPFSPVFAPLGDAAVLVTLSDSMGREVNRQVHACASAIRDAKLQEVLDVVPAYASLAVHYDASAVEVQEITARLREIVIGSFADESRREEGRLLTIPVRYEGPDLSAVADATGLTTKEVIAKHSGAEYFVYMMGFAPGFAYLGELDAALHLPRRATPRTRVPAGSVAIAGSQTAIYPMETPGGWHLLGSTDLRLFDAERDPPSLLKAGDRVRFERIR